MKLDLNKRTMEYKEGSVFTLIRWTPVRLLYVGSVIESMNSSLPLYTAEKNKGEHENGS